MVRDEAVIEALMTSPSIRKASAKCGLSESAIYQRLRKPEFIKKYDHARLELLQRNRDRLQQHVLTAVETLGTLAESAKSEQTRLNAAEAVIRMSLKLTEQTDILRRLEALEENIE